jgi:Fe-S cluster assembly protein SufB/Fe-S cluster assembly protein SufD
LTKFVEIEETRYNEDAEIEQHYKYRWYFVWMD